MPFKTFFLKASVASLTLFKYACIAHCTFTYLGKLVLCTGPSMNPTIESNDIVLTESVAIHRRNVKKGDVVIARSPQDPNQYICKRVVGVAGDLLRDNTQRKYVPRGHVWLEGDNSDNSIDSRHYGAVPYGLLDSRIVFRLWPLRNAGKLPTTDAISYN